MNALMQDRLMPATSQRRQWVAMVPAGTTKEDTLNSEFWAHVAKSFHPLDELICVDDNMKFRLELIVVDAWGLGAKMQIISEIDLWPADDEKHQSGLKLSWKGPFHRWSIVQEETGAIVKGGFLDKITARQELASRAAILR